MKQIMVVGNITPKPLFSAWDEVQRRMRIVNYQNCYICSYQSSVNAIGDFMRSNRYGLYSPMIGNRFLESRQSLKREEKAIVQHLDLALTSMFWGEYYGTKSYLIRNAFLNNAIQRLLNDLDLEEVKGKWRVVRGVSILDIFMFENGITHYSLDVGDKFLQCMDTVSTLSEDLVSRIYQSTISRINAYFVGKTPNFRRGDIHIFYSEELQKNIDGLINRLNEKQFSNLRIPRNILIGLDRYMGKYAIEQYTPQVGADFIEYYKKQNPKSKGKSVAATIAHFNDFILGNPFNRSHTKPQKPLPEMFMQSLNLYLEEELENGNKESTIIQKYDSCKLFISQLIQEGVHAISEVSSPLVVEACATLSCCHWNTIRGYLHWCALNKYTTKDYSFLVPHKKHSTPIPPYYTKEERQRLEAAPNRETPIGKRDYAIILIINRLGLRSSDIVNLDITKIHQGITTIDFEQYKTKIFHSLPLLAEISDAIDDYINNGRPNTDSKKLFITAIAPYKPLDHLSIHGIITKYFRLAGVDITKKRHGGHALRSSLGTDLVNNGFTYDETKYVLGHQDRNSTRHYAVIDIRNLRTCAIKPHPPGGIFETTLYKRRR